MRHGGDAVVRPAEHRPAHVPGRSGVVSRRVGGVCRRVRGAGAGVGCAPDRWLLRAASRTTSRRSAGRWTSTGLPATPFLGGRRRHRGRSPPPPRRACSAQRLTAGEWVVSVELDPPKGSNLERLYELVDEISATRGVEFFDINDNPMARARMSSLMTAALVQGRASVETIPHLTPRDTTARGLESQLLGAHAAGIRNILAVTGDYRPPGDNGGSDAAYQLDAIGLVEMIAAMNAGTDRAGKVLDAPTDFLVGVAVNPTADDPDVELDRFHRKVAAGAQFAMTQVLFDLDPLRRLLTDLDNHPPIPILVGLWPVTSHALALRLHHEVPGITVPEPTLTRLAHADAHAATTGVAITRELLAGSREQLAAGAYLVTPFGQPERILDVLA